MNLMQLPDEYQNEPQGREKWHRILACAHTTAARRLFLLSMGCVCLGSTCISCINRQRHRFHISKLLSHNSLSIFFIVTQHLEEEIVCNRWTPVPLLSKWCVIAVQRLFAKDSDSGKCVEEKVVDYKINEFLKFLC